MLQRMLHENDKPDICSLRMQESLSPNKISEIINITASEWEHDGDLELQYLDIDSLGKLCTSSKPLLHGENNTHTHTKHCHFPAWIPVVPWIGYALGPSRIHYFFCGPLHFLNWGYNTPRASRLFWWIRLHMGHTPLVLWSNELQTLVTRYIIENRQSVCNLVILFSEPLAHTQVTRHSHAADFWSPAFPRVFQLQSTQVPREEQQQPSRTNEISSNTVGISWIHSN